VIPITKIDNLNSVIKFSYMLHNTRRSFCFGMETAEVGILQLV